MRKYLFLIDMFDDIFDPLGFFKTFIQKESKLRNLSDSDPFGQFAADMAFSTV